MMNKAALRTQFKNLRKALPVSQLLYDSWAITEQLIYMIDWKKYRVFHVFLPILSKHELNTFPLIHYLWRTYPHLQICIPHVNRQTQRIENLLLTSEMRLATKDFGPYPLKK